ALYREGSKSGRVMAIALHPYVMGMPHRIGALERALDFIAKHTHVWSATGSEIVEAYLEQIDSDKR
ncbi:MAG TPA: polysaccharide deacetylase, partial [Beijerinckiaceae bacterium]|nr:polysaccharide deacetylase [Beijerinckiaceae bacterium]